MSQHRPRTARALCAAGLFVAVSASRSVTAEPVATQALDPAATLFTIDGQPGRRLVVDAPVAGLVSRSAVISPTIYLERCIGGCSVHRGTDNDSRSNTSTIPKVQNAVISEFVNGQGQRGAAADAEWGQLVQCLREVYSPYNIQVTDVRPSGDYHEAIVAGVPSDIGLASDILGVAPLASDCRAIDDVMSFTFANHHPPTDRLLNICWTAAQESAHAFGLDHEYSFSGNRSACSDPMTYRNDCGGEKFFRNEPASCGEYTSRACKCGASQNSHQKLLSVFGPGTPITGPPAVTLTAPTGGSGLGRLVSAQAGGKRGIARVEAWFNGFSWASAPGAVFGPSGQANPSPYSIAVPAALPDGIVDVKAVAYDDLGAAASSTTVTVTKGAPCVTAATCAAHQKCEAGRCFWDPPVGELGDGCTYPQLCKSGICRGATGAQTCAQDCVAGVEDGCPVGFDCMAGSDGHGECVSSSGGGCCSADRGGQGWLVPGASAALLLGLLARRRRR